MSVIEASSGTYRSRVDGTIVLSVEIEPRFRAEALALFGMPGTPVALAALKAGHASKSDKEVGYWCLRAVQRCKEPEFWEWIKFASLNGKAPKSEEDAAKVVREVCGVKSRNELDDDFKARQLFQTKMDFPYMAWLKQPA